jgi:hypothetical protein
VDAKSRHRKADGSIVSEAEEEAERARVQAELDAKYAGGLHHTSMRLILTEISL